MRTKVNQELEKILEKFGSKYMDNGTVLKSKIIKDLDTYNEELLKFLMSSKLIRKHFTINVSGVTILQINKLINLLESDTYWEDSYTKYSNKIGLTSGGKFIYENEDVVLSFPYKDTILKASMSKEDTDKDKLRPNEPFLNKIIAKEEIDVLLDKKIFSNIKKYHDDGTCKPVDCYRDENLLIKGNNLIALHSIKSRFTNLFDVIYIDPPYNVSSSNNTFVYNNRFNHSTWLTFMKNRLEIAKDLLKKDEGVLIVAIDDNEVNYLGVLLDEIFTQNYYEKHMITVVHNPRGVQGTNFSYSHEYLYFVFPRGKKIIEDRELSENEISYSNLRNWGGESLRTDGKNTFFPIKVCVETNEIIGFGDIVDDNVHPKQTEIKDGVAYVYPIDNNGVERKWRYARQTIESIKGMLKVRKVNDSKYEIMIGKNFGQYKTVWKSPRYDASVHGKQLLGNLVPGNDFSFPKSVYAVYDALKAVIKNKPNAKVLDFFSGSGTTAHAVQMLNNDDKGKRKYVMIEQMPYIETVQIPRLLSTDANKMNDDFIYMEILEKNQGFIDKIRSCQCQKDVDELFENMLVEAEIDFRVDLEKVKETLWELSLAEQKRVLFDIIEKNQLYFNYSEIEDENVKRKLSKNDYHFNKNFYEGSE